MIETFYTGGGIWITTYLFEENEQPYYLTISNDCDFDCIAKYKKTEDEFTFYPEDMVETFNVNEEGFQKYRDIYNKMLEHHKEHAR